ncbi:hypothetical protein PoB_004428200 [Plakobranchus ocellatus]|uniref:Uncharacterized protein n=1 Tax=Plakobranchus ocellatus TaxID=259542 RepID=A0AAV4BFN8_9GAST|nr:hypothetical protein PoB_004428200 [Plakobranchus ocellatus]
MSHTLCWEYSSRVALTQRWSTAQRVPLVGLRGGQGALELNLKTYPMTKSKNTPDPPHYPTWRRSIAQRQLVGLSLLPAKGRRRTFLH